jgi:hypothetical protein
MLERMMLGLDEDVEAGHRLEQRRIGVGDPLELGSRQMKADRDRILSFVKKLTG